MAQSNSDSAQNLFNISNSTITNLAGGSIQYSEAHEHDASLEAESRRKVILFLAAQPIATARLRLDEEVREIEAGLQRSKHRDRFDLKQRWAVRPADLRRALLDHKPEIVHFAGHGQGSLSSAADGEETRKLTPINTPIHPVKSPEAGLILEDQAGQPKLVSTEALAALFALFESVKCVVLNACYSEQQAIAIAQHIPYVIGMNQAIGDRAAIEFSIGFYDALGAGESIEFAYRLGCSAIQMAGIPEHLTPTLMQRSD